MMELAIGLTCSVLHSTGTGYEVAIINPWRMREGYGSPFVHICYHTSCHIPRLYIDNKVPLNFLWLSQDMYCVDFVENALFKSSGHIC